MMEMSREMMKAGIIEEMLDDAMESLEDGEEMEDAAQVFASACALDDNGESSSPIAPSAPPSSSSRPRWTRCCSS